MKIAIETITPKKAAEGLEHNDANRPMRASRVSRLAEAINRSEWMLNGESIKFNCNGRLIDGQHRLAAVVESGKSIQSYVVRGLPEQAFDTLDQGAVRTIADVLARNGELYYKQLASAIRWIGILHHKMNWKSVGYTPDQAKAMLGKHQKVRDSVARFTGDAQKSMLIPPGLTAACHYLFAKKDQTLADLFIGGLLTGEGLKRSDPVYLLRERLIRNNSEQAKLDKAAIAALTIKAWNATRAGIPMRTLKWVEESLPEVK